jgi:hypothetical protein
MLQELISKMKDTHGLTTEQSHGILGTVTGFIKEKFPMFSGAIDNMFNAPAAAAETAAPQAAAAATPVAEEARKEESSMMDKISDVIPGQAGEKVEEFAKNAAHKAEEVFDSVKDKLSGLFGGGTK